MNIVVYLKNRSRVEMPNATYSFRDCLPSVNQPVLIVYNWNTNMEIGVFVQNEVAGVVKEVIR